MDAEHEETELDLLRRQTTTLDRLYNLAWAWTLIAVLGGAAWLVAVLAH